ncbi:DUF2268 domain-containing protein [Alteribacter natronophilus]|uniref:DUF2268 domain-containing protein n=1 Tax=Alteribacter natronophilus TaxID=2583810 RepID=UPI00110D8C66|nr:DUF2268 domain-containing putative Zn-dependent protease [Alteribacter natronophilus]TMW72913.1 hypothetical protein FGB90_00955 [Alteribacter natronophilus]
MGIILNDIIPEDSGKPGTDAPEFLLRNQAETVCEPMLDHFKNRPYLIGWHQYLLGQGLRRPDGDWQGFYRKMTKSGAADELSNHFARFKKYWKGPDIPVYLLPIDMENEELLKRLNRKNGVTFPECIVLFVDETLPLPAMKALLTHEYNHACRLMAQNNDEASVTLLESMVMEGLAEAAVKKALGEKELAPWTGLHSKEKCMEWWDNVLRRERRIKNRRHHDHFMYGGDGLPPMIGYAAGYHLVGDYIKHTPEHTGRARLKVPAEKILQESGWPH